MYESSHGSRLALIDVRVAPKTALVLCRPGSLISLSSWTVGRSLNTDLTRSCWMGTQCTHVCLAQEHPFLQALGREARTLGRGMQRRFLHQEEGGRRMWLREMYGAVAAEL